jgi:signal transduction histidine kinase/CheY-like chemotaxis protein
MRILSLELVTETDVVATRQRARQVAALLGFGHQDQARIATAVSELARNVIHYAGRGRAAFVLEDGDEGEGAPQQLAVRIEDQGPGIAHLDLVLSGRYQSPTGMGVGLTGARRLMDSFDIDTAAGTGTRITVRKQLPPEATRITAARLGELGQALAELPVDATLAEVRQQNRELVAALAELKVRQDELLQLTRELEDTNRGVVALYAELDEKADHLRRADAIKSRFLSNMSHEFRTPLSSIRALAKLLLDRVDGPLSPDQDKQVRFILTGAESLSDLVDDLLDLAKIEAGKVAIRPSAFDVTGLFSALRGMLRPLQGAASVELVFADGAPIDLYTDEAKLSQILRNFITNALKFTEAGFVRVGAELLDGDLVRFTVADTGIGIAPADLQLIFEEFGQVENPLQYRAKGTGLGLPLCRKLAMLLGGQVEVTSTPGQGSVFSTTVPRRYAAPEAPASAPAARPVLVVENDAASVLLYEKYLAGSPYQLVAARSVREAAQLWSSARPAAVVLDPHLDGEDTWRWLSSLKDDAGQRSVPVIVATDGDDCPRASALGADACLVKPLAREQLLAELGRLLVPSTATAEP